MERNKHFPMGFMRGGKEGFLWYSLSPLLKPLEYSPLPPHLNFLAKKLKLPFYEEIFVPS
jgi:hypothetical protein